MILVKKRKLGDDDLALWLRVKSTIAPLRGRQSPIHEIFPEPKLPSRPKASSPLSSSGKSHNPRHASQPMPTTNLDGLARSQRRAMRRGALSPSARVDLHGLRLEAAHARLVHFLQQSARDGHRLVLIITGKGGFARQSDFGRETSGVIRRAFPDWMAEREIARLVSHYAPAHIKHGGDGAWYVYLRNKNRSSNQKHRR